MQLHMSPPHGAHRMHACTKPGRCTLWRMRIMSWLLSLGLAGMADALPRGWPLSSRSSTTHSPTLTCAHRAALTELTVR